MTHAMCVRRPVDFDVKASQDAFTAGFPRPSSSRQSVERLAIGDFAKLTCRGRLMSGANVLQGKKPSFSAAVSDPAGNGHQRRPLPWPRYLGLAGIGKL